MLDTDGDALLHGIEAGPTIVSPNQPEAERLLNRALITRAQFLEAATRIKAMGAEAVMLSLGGRGVVAVNENQLLEVIPPRTDAVSPLGAGDALAAAYVWAATKKKDFADCVRWAVAAGTASAKLAGAGVREPGTNQGSLKVGGSTEGVDRFLTVRGSVDYWGAWVC